MGIGYDIKKGRVYDGGNERLRYKIRVPVIEGAEWINELYRKISEDCEGFCRLRICECVENNNGEKLFYELLCRVCHEDPEVVSVLMRVRLLRGGHAVESHVRAHNWSLSEQCMLPPKLLLRRYAKKGKAKYKEDEGLFLSQGEMRSINDTQIDRFFV